ncbi:MAG: C_GCAxxG_C_C family protein [Flavobacteriaceae bacterium]|nr:C_GCAxxG_C_C family protein [Flavobacteriaceae bacterium]
MDSSLNINNDAKKVFRDCGTCSRTFAHLLNREFGHVKEDEERALNPLAGGIMNLGHQCGMLWGASLAIGAEAYRQHENLDDAIAVAVSATEQIVKSFEKRTNTIHCKEIIGYDLTSIIGMTKFMLKVTLQGMNNSHCFNLAEEWAPEAVEAAKNGLAKKNLGLNQKIICCASEVVRELGGSDEETIMAAGYSGGLGLSGHACGALSAAIWKNMLDWCIMHPTKNPPYYNNKTAKKLLKNFQKVTNGEMQCSKICNQKFKTIKVHSDYIKNGGCRKIVEVLTSD